MFVKQSEKQIGKQKVFITEFGNISEMVYRCSLEDYNAESFHGEKSSQDGDYSFTKTKTYAEAQDLLKNGWGEGAKKLTLKLKLANAEVAPKEVKRAVYDIAGFQASVPRYLQGVPTNMINKRSVKQQQKSVTLLKSISYKAGYSADDIMNDSVKFLQIVQEIEKQGIRVNVYTVFHAIRNDEEIFIKTKIKSATERLNISKMSYPLIHPSFLRRHIFKVMESELRVKNSWGYGYGTPAKAHETSRVLTEKGEYFIPVMVNNDKALEIISNIKNK